jgi:hypothetical protein
MKKMLGLEKRFEEEKQEARKKKHSWGRRQGRARMLSNGV